MRSLTIAAAVAASILSSSIVFAAGPTNTKSKTKTAKVKKPKAEMVASAEPLPQLPPSRPATAAGLDASAGSVAPAPVKDEAAAKHVDGQRESAGTGFVLVLGSGASFLGGKIAEGIDIAAGLVTFELKVGAYITPHFGIMGGVQGGYGALFEGCAGTCSNAYHYQLPLVAQYAFTDRTRGAYLEGGLALLSTYGGSTAPRHQSPETLEGSMPVDLKVGAGYRVPIGRATEKAAMSALDLRVGVDLGQFKRVEYGSVVGEVAGDIADDRQAMHFALGLSVGWHFTP
jgi:hypothetical protein